MAAPPTQAPWSPAPPRQLRQGLAITSMVLGILSIFTGCFPILGLTGVILSIIALTKAARRPLEYGGKGFAIAGLCTSLASFVFMFMFMAILLPSLSKARDLAKRSVCTANLTSLGNAFRGYANQYQGQYPPEVDALVVSGLVGPGQFICPSSGKHSDYSTAAMSYSPGQPVSPKIHEALHSCYVYIPGQTEKGNPSNVLMYEKKECHDGEGANVLFLDGSSRWIEPYSEVEKLVAQTEALQESPAEVEVKEP